MAISMLPVMVAYVLDDGSRSVRASRELSVRMHQQPQAYLTAFKASGCVPRHRWNSAITLCINSDNVLPLSESSDLVVAVFV